MALGSTQPLSEMGTRTISWGAKATGALNWQPYHLHVPTVLKFGSLSLLEPSGSVQACTGIALPFYLVMEMRWYLRRRNWVFKVLGLNCYQSAHSHDIIRTDVTRIKKDGENSFEILWPCTYVHCGLFVLLWWKQTLPVLSTMPQMLRGVAVKVRTFLTSGPDEGYLSQRSFQEHYRWDISTRYKFK